MESITEYEDFGDNSDYFFYLKGYGCGVMYSRGCFECNGKGWDSTTDIDCHGAGIRLGQGTTKGTGYG